MIVRDWRELPAETLMPLYASASARWRDVLHWDMSDSWSTVETARTTWGLPGLVCMSPAGVIGGWAFYMVTDGRLDVGGLSASTTSATEALVDALIERGGSPAALRGLLYDAAPDFARILALRDVPFVPYSYMMRSLDASAEPLATDALSLGQRTLRQWSDEDLDDTARLLREVHGDGSGLVPPSATHDDWCGYVRNLVQYGGCGTLSPVMSHALEIDGRLAAVSLVSVIGPGTAHLVQLAVRRDSQGRGIGRALLEMSLDVARVEGHTAMSLLVSEQSQPARRLYQDVGFLDRGAFVSLCAPEGVSLSG